MTHVKHYQRGVIAHFDPLWDYGDLEYNFQSITQANHFKPQIMHRGTS